MDSIINDVTRIGLCQVTQRSKVCPLKHQGHDKPSA